MERALWSLMATMVVLSRTALSQCTPEWNDAFGSSSINNVITSMASFDDDGDGSNPIALFVGGSFTSIDGNTINRVAKRSGSSWVALGSGLANTAYAMTVFDTDGSGSNPDFNCSGGTPDEADSSTFFAAWSSGDPSADVNRSGGAPDDADVDFFFQHWNEGC